jgi:hypothetical protein
MVWVEVLLTTVLTTVPDELVTAMETDIVPLAEPATQRSRTQTPELIEVAVENRGEKR